jgi:tetratricopeptide (TPR) repeat protein
VFEVGLQSACEEINDAFSKGNLPRVDQLLWPALDQFSEIPQLWFYAGNLAFRTGKAALASACFERALELDDSPLVRSNLGAAYRKLNRHEDGLAVLRSTIDRYPDYEPALVNYGAMFVNEGTPEQGIPALERAVSIGRARGKPEQGAEWNLGLLYLESGRFGDGFDIYRNGYGAERLVRTYAHGEVPEPKRLEHEDHAAVLAGAALGKPRPTLLVWGEQGIGDELMFGTVLNDAIYRYDIVFECHPRLERLHRNSSWARALAEQGRPVRIYPTRKEEYIGWPIADSIRADFKCPIGDLSAFYRRDVASFKDSWKQHGPSYTYNVPEAESYRAQLAQIAQGRPIIGLAIHGGVINTARMYRTLRLPELEHLVENTNALFVALDYDDMTPYVLHLREKFGAGRYTWFPSIVQHYDFEHTSALLAATDANLLVCQSAAHLSAHIGRTTWVLTPQRHAWRYAKAGDPQEWYWAPSPDVKLLRQTDPVSWKKPLDDAIELIRGISG